LKPRLLFIPHVDWGHIWQRPQHLAAGLARTYDVTVAYPLSRRRSGVVRHACAPVRLVPLWRVPGTMRSGRLLAINRVLLAAQLRRLARRVDPGTIWVTSPEAWAAVRHEAGGRTLVYDCMDDALAFAQPDDVRRARATWERELLARADVIFCSSSVLAERCIARGAAVERVTLVRNGWDPVAFPVAPAQPLPAEGPLVLGYFGAIGDWIDFAALVGLVRSNADVTVRLIGPNECRYVSPDARISLLPPVPHRDLAAVAAGCDAMLLPFKVTELTRAVDPVKLYEYVALGLPVLSAYWPELAPFAPFVTFYGDSVDLVRRVGQRSAGIAAVPDAAKRATFLAEQSWDARLRVIDATLASLRPTSPA